MKVTGGRWRRLQAWEAFTVAAAAFKLMVTSSGMCSWLDSYLPPSLALMTPCCVLLLSFTRGLPSVCSSPCVSCVLLCHGATFGESYLSHWVS